MFNHAPAENITALTFTTLWANSAGYNLVIFFNDRFYLSFFVAMQGFRASDFDYY